MKETVLVIDDTPTNLQVMAGFLSHAGYHVIVAEDGEQGVKVAARARPALILLDIMMPRIDGFETCRRLKTEDVTKGIPILFLTARSDTDDKVRGFQAGAVDYITKPYHEEEVLARVGAHLTLARQKGELEAMLAERDRFMRIAAHDLRNPLSVVLGWSAMGRESAGSEEDRETFEHIETAAGQMQAIIEDFLALQVLRKDGQAEAVEFDLRRVVRQIADQQGSAARNKEIALDLEPSTHKAMTRGNAAHVHQILTNYFSNAIKYSPRGTRVAVSVERRDGAWRVAVRDQGPGIAPAERDKLFIEFAKISNKPTAGETSTGLGLAIVKRLAEAQGGRAGADFPDGGGSVFWVEIPVALETPGPGGN